MISTSNESYENILLVGEVRFEICNEKNGEIQFPKNHSKIYFWVVSFEKWFYPACLGGF